jgi:hypothetical protein
MDVGFCGQAHPSELPEAGRRAGFHGQCHLLRIRVGGHVELL